MNSKDNDARTVYYPVRTHTWLKKEEIEEYLCTEPFDREDDCIDHCKRTGIEKYTLECQIKKPILFDSELEFEWITVYLTIKKVAKCQEKS